MMMMKNGVAMMIEKVDVNGDDGDGLMAFDGGGARIHRLLEMVAKLMWRRRGEIWRRSMRRGRWKVAMMMMIWRRYEVVDRGSGGGGWWRWENPRVKVLN